MSMIVQADLELALLRLELFLGQFPRRGRRVDPVTDRRDPERRVGDLAGDPQLDAANSGPGSAAVPAEPARTRPGPRSARAE